MTSIRDVDLKDRRVFMRLDLNVPIKDGKVKSDARIRAALPTIQYAMDAGAIVALASHLGRPDGEVLPEARLEPVGVRLSELLGTDVLLADDCVGDGVQRLVRQGRPGQLILLENLRFHAGETKNEPEFSRRLAHGFEVYINDAFGAAHRAHASIVGVPARLPVKAAGLLLASETRALARLLERPDRPFVAIVGGAKVADKLGVLEALLQKVNAIYIGGAMAYTFLRAQGKVVGASRVEENKLAAAKAVLHRAAERGVQLVLPCDHVVGDRFAATTAPSVIAAIPDGRIGLDIGPESAKAIAMAVAAAGTVFWNGPMGVFEWDAYAAGTMAVAQAVAACRGFTVVGGGDSVAAIEKAGVVDKIGHVSTGGGASLEFLEQGTLPGIEALKG